MIQWVYGLAEIFASRDAPLESMTPAAKLPLVSTTPAENFAASFASVVDTGGKQWEQLSDC
jgi:hypothetical protein